MKVPATLNNVPVVEAKFEIRLTQDWGFAEILAIEYQSLLDSQCEIDPEIDAIISESLSDLYMTD